MSKQKIALISGITGQDGSYLAEFLLDKGYSVHGISRRVSGGNLSRIDHIKNMITLHDADLSDQNSLCRIVRDVEPNEVYNLAAQSFVGSSWDQPIATSEMTGLGATRMLEAVRMTREYSKKDIKFYQASSSEMFGHTSNNIQNETTPFYPRSPYGVSKLYAHWMTINYRESHNLYAVSGILFNHESPRRGIEFVTRKISMAVAKIKMGWQDKLFLGNLHARRDWGYAGDYVEAMWLMLQRSSPMDFVIATGKTYTVRQFVESAFAHVGLDWSKYVEIDEKLMRPAEVNYLCGDASLAKKHLGWSPKFTFDDLVSTMIAYDLAYVKNCGGNIQI